MLVFDHALTARASAAAKRAQASEAVGWKRMLGGF